MDFPGTRNLFVTLYGGTNLNEILELFQNVTNANKYTLRIQ